MRLKIRRLSLRAKLALLLLAIVALAAALGVWSAHLFHGEQLAWSLVVAAAVLPVMWLAQHTFDDISGAVVVRSGKDVKPSIVVVVKKRDAGSSCLNKVSCVIDRATNRWRMQPGRFANINQPAPEWLP